MQLTLNIPDETAVALESRGVHISAFIQAALQKEAGPSPSHRDQAAIEAAVDRIIERRKNLRLDGLKIRDLIDEGRRY
jgi:post-segregation antitoxin (ccd killing protein)